MWLAVQGRRGDSPKPGQRGAGEEVEARGEAGTHAGARLGLLSIAVCAVCAMYTDQHSQFSCHNLVEHLSLSLSLSLPLSLSLSLPLSLSPSLSLRSQEAVAVDCRVSALGNQLYWRRYHSLTHTVSYIVYTMYIILELLVQHSLLCTNSSCRLKLEESRTPSCSVSDT